MLLSGQLEESALDCVMLVYEKDDYDPRECVRFVHISVSLFQSFSCTLNVSGSGLEGDVSTIYSRFAVV